MNSFVNREDELTAIEDALSALQSKHRLLRTPIIEFYGVNGIGKTTMLRKVQQRCSEEKLQHIWADANQSISNFSSQIIHQAQKYSTKLRRKQSDQDLLNQSVDATRALLEQGPLVMLFDSLDRTNEEKLLWIESLLRIVIDDNKLFVVLASTSELLFDNDRSVVRKLTPFSLKPFGREVCESYLEGIGNIINTGIRASIYDWTRGYPLAMDVMLQAILTQGLDPRKDEDKKRLLDILTEEVIYRGLLSNIETNERDWFLSLLELFSVPRRFNLVIMQDLVQKFASTLALESSLAYVGLPKRINQSIDVLSWNLHKAGFAIDAPVRNIFLLKLRIEQPERYLSIHSFLAELNQRFAAEVFGSDRVRYLEEYLYHSTFSKDIAALPQILEQTVQRIIAESPESFLQFSEEFKQDEELKEALGNHVNIVISLINQNLAQMNRQFAAAASGLNRVRYLQEVFYYIMHDPEVIDLSFILRNNIQQLIAEESPEVAFKLYEELAQDPSFRDLLGEDFDRFYTQIRHNFSLEG